MENELIDKLTLLLQVLVTVVGAASMILAGLRQIANITPNTMDDVWVGKAERFIARIVAVLDRLALNPDKTAAREPKKPGDAG